MTDVNLIYHLRQIADMLRASRCPDSASQVDKAVTQLGAASGMAVALRKLKDSGEILENEDAALASWIMVGGQ